MENSIKTEIVNYVKKTSIHTFVKPKATFKWGNSATPSYYEYDYSEGTYFKVWLEGEEIRCLEDGKVKSISIEDKIKWYGKNAKNVIKHTLFLDKGMKSIRNTKRIKQEIEEILKS